jgi:signal transduction histidine kinase
VWAKLKRRFAHAPRERSGDGEIGRVGALLELWRAASGDWDAFIRRAVELDAKAIHAHRASYWSVSGTSASMQCEACYVPAPEFFVRGGAALSRTACPEYYDALLEGRIVSIDDVQGDPRTRAMREELAAPPGSSILSIPVLVEGRVAGVLRHDHVGANRRWSGEDVHVAMSVCQVIASALAARAHTRFEVAARRAEYLDNLSCELFRLLDVPGVAQRAVELMVPELGDGAFVHALNPDGTLESLATMHVDPTLREVVATIGRYETSQVDPPGLPGVVAYEGQSLLHAGVTASQLEQYGIPPPLRQLVLKLGPHGAMGVPLRIGERVIGAITLLGSEHRFGPDELALAEEVGKRVAAALENARLYAMACDAIHARDEFLVLAAHELRTPLTALELESARLRRRGGPNVAVDDTIGRQLRRLGELVEQMLDVAHIRAEGIVLDRELSDLAAIVGASVRSKADRARTAGCPIAVAARAPSSLMGRWDRARLGQVIDGLLDNAIKFGNKQPIDVLVEREGASAVLAVHDHGLGIPDDCLSSIFSPFERAVSKEHFGGLGLGLFLAKSIVEAHGGSIAATSRLGEGSTFVVHLPLALPHEESAASSSGTVDRRPRC